jgi:hypothetical protein
MALAFDSTSNLLLIDEWMMHSSPSTVALSRSSAPSVWDMSYACVHADADLPAAGLASLLESLSHAYQENCKLTWDAIENEALTSRASLTDI